jgi:hypothetical protein
MDPGVIELAVIAPPEAFAFAACMGSLISQALIVPRWAGSFSLPRPLGLSHLKSINPLKMIRTRMAVFPPRAR